MTNQQLIHSQTPQLTRKYSTILLEIMEKIDLHDMADKTIPGRQITFGHAAKHIICSYIRGSYPEPHAVMEVKQSFDKGELDSGLRAIEAIYSLPICPERDAKWGSEVEIFGIELEYERHETWSCPSLYVAYLLQETQIEVPLSSIPAEDVLEYTASKIVEMLEGEINLAGGYFIDQNAFKAFASDHCIFIKLPQNIIRSHAEDIDRWIIERAKSYRQWVCELRNNSVENAALHSRLQQEIDNWMAKPGRVINLCHPHERQIINAQPAYLKLEASVMFAYRDEIDDEDCDDELDELFGQEQPDHWNENEDRLYVCAIATSHAGSFALESFHDRNYQSLILTITQYLIDYRRQVQKRLELYAIAEPLDHVVHPICAIMLHNADATIVAQTIEALRSKHDNEPLPFSHSVAKDKRIIPFEARMRKDELQLSFPLATNAYWDWNALFIDMEMPLSMISGLHGQPLRTILDATQVDEKLGSLLITSAKRLQKNIRIDIEPARIKIKDIV